MTAPYLNCLFLASRLNILNIIIMIEYLPKSNLNYHTTTKSSEDLSTCNYEYTIIIFLHLLAMIF